jgi:two-component system, sensor histidine kinase and response regulator
MKIYKTILISSLAISLIPLLFTGYISSYIASDSIQKSILIRLDALASIKSEKLDVFFNERFADLANTKERFVLMENLPILTANKDDKTSQAYRMAENDVNVQLTLLKDNYHYADVMLAEREGGIIYSTNTTHGREMQGKNIFAQDGEALKKALGGAYVSGVISTGDSGYPYTIFLVGPVHGRNGEIAGFLVLEIDMQQIYGLINDTKGLGESGETLLVMKNPEGRVVFISPLRYDSNALMKKTVTYGDPSGIPAQKAADGENGSALSVDYRGTKVISAWRTVPSMGWGMVTKVDEAEIFSPINKQNYLMALILVISTMMVVLTSMVVAKSISDPIHVLHRGTEIVGAGNLDYRVSLMTRDEIGQLSRAFDSMTESIKNKTTSIEFLTKEIDERKKSEKELEKMNRFMTDREQRIIELKEKIKELEEKIPKG